AEPPIRQIEMHFLAQASLGADAEAVADDQHPDHQLRINRWPPKRAVERRQLPPQLTEFHEPINLAQQMVGWNVPFERELIEQSSLFDLRMPHHDSLSCFSQQLNQRISRIATADFFNKIGPLPTSQ